MRSCTSHRQSLSSEKWVLLALLIASAMSPPSQYPIIMQTWQPLSTHESLYSTMNGFLTVAMSCISWWADRRVRSVCRASRIFFNTYFFFSTLCLTSRAEPNAPLPICSSTSY
uniref:Uncharacterized protein n=1 Tax=Arundo donax TaxID=35708 RepID=A0A0A9EGG1_ARUDO